MRREQNVRKHREIQEKYKKNTRKIQEKIRGENKY